MHTYLRSGLAALAATMVLVGCSSAEPASPTAAPPPAAGDAGTTGGAAGDAADQGADQDKDTSTGTGGTDEEPILAPDGAGGIAVHGDAKAAIDSLDFETLVSVWESTVPDLERAEMVGDVLHLYLADSGSVSASIIACTVVNTTGGDRASEILVHIGDQTTPC